MTRQRTEQEREESPSGILECTDCGMKFKLTDGDTVLIDHFQECIR